MKTNVVFRRRPTGFDEETSMKRARLHSAFLLPLVLGLAFAPQAGAQEEEPNNSCLAAQNLTTASIPVTVNGSLDSPPISADVDFYRISATPGTLLRVSLEGLSSGKGTLSDSILGAYSDDCSTLLASDDDSGAGFDSLLVLNMPASGILVLAATSYADYSFTGNGFYSGSYRLTVTPAQTARSIAGHVIDMETGSPVPDASVTLTRCGAGVCGDFVGSALTGLQGEFLFEDGGFNVFSPLLAGDYQITVQRLNYESAQVGPFPVSVGQQLDLGNIQATRLPSADSIRGRLVDAVTRVPLPGPTEPFAAVELFYCNPEPFCSPVQGARVASDGTFFFQGDSSLPLVPGTYQLLAQADQYQATLSQTFQVASDQNVDFGDFGVKSYPVRIYLDQSCGEIPASGGECQFRMLLVNGSPSRFVGEAWSIVLGSDLGAPVLFTTFQAGPSKGISLASGSSVVMPMSFFVPADISNGAFICTEGYAAQRPHAFNTLGHHSLFCLVKGASGFARVPEERLRDVVRRMRTEPPYSTGRR
jgi:carboxypeptidase family protein